VREMRASARAPRARGRRREQRSAGPLVGGGAGARRGGFDLHAGLVTRAGQRDRLDQVDPRSRRQHGEPLQLLGFLQHLETTRHNHVATRNQRLAGLRTFFEYVGRRLPEMLHVCERVAAIPTKRTPLPETRFLDREEIATLFARLPREGRQANRTTRCC
jgi:integrase